MKSNIVLRVTWHRITETYWYPERWWDNVSRVSSWRAALCIDGDTHTIETIKTLETSGITLALDWQAGLAKWNKINQVDRIERTENGILVWLPRMAEPDNEAVSVRVFDGISEYEFTTTSSNCPNSKATADPLESHLQWIDGQAHLEVSTEAVTNVQWHHQSDGAWYMDCITQPVTKGSHSFLVDVPFSEVAYLEVLTTSVDHSSRHRYYAVGKPGIASGRYVWYRGTMYAPKMTRTLPWVSVIAPVMHPDDIERVPAFVKWNQVEWWVYPGVWADEAVAMIKRKFPRAGIIRLGKYGDSDADIQVLRPLDVQSSQLVPGQRYTVQMFDDAGDTEYGRRSGWVLDRLMRKDMENLRFVERSWRQGLIPQNPPDGLPQYGLAFSFTRPPGHEHLWPAAQRDVEWRENKENFPCQQCSYKAACKQALPMPYAVEDIKRIPWVSLERGDCPMPRWFALTDVASRL